MKKNETSTNNIGILTDNKKIEEYPNTLLKKYLLEKSSAYHEPQRAGTPKGEPVGFSLLKYKATLFGLTNVKQKDIASDMKISHGLLRKWHTEEPFKALVDRHCREFAALFMKNIGDRVNRRKTAVSAYSQQPLAEMVSTDLPSLDYNEIADAKFYSELTEHYIADAMESEIKKAGNKKDFTLIIEIHAMIDSLRFFKGKSQSEVSKEFDRKILKTIRTNMISEVIEKMQKLKLTEQERKDIIQTMKLLRKGIE
jgi:hypothetical protein